MAEERLETTLAAVVGELCAGHVQPSRLRRPLRAPACGARWGDRAGVVAGDRPGQAAGELRSLPKRGSSPAPDRPPPPRLHNLVREPLELLAIASVERQGGQAIEHLRRAQP